MGLQAQSQDRDPERQEAATHTLKPVAFIHAPHRAEPETRPLPRAETPGAWDSGLQPPSPLPKTRSCEPEVFKVLVCHDPLDPDGCRTLNSVPGGQGIAPASQSSEREERRACRHHHWGWGFAKLTAVLGWREPRMEPSSGSPKRVGLGGCYAP